MQYAGNALASSEYVDNIYTFKLGGALPKGQVIDARQNGRSCC